MTRIRKKIKWSVIPESVSEVVWLLTLCGQERFLYRVIFRVKQKLNKRSQPAGGGGKNAWSNTDGLEEKHSWYQRGGPKADSREGGERGAALCGAGVPKPMKNLLRSPPNGK